MASKKWAHPFPLCAAVGPAGTYTSAVDGIAAHTVTSPDDQDSAVYLTEIQLRKVTVIICEHSAPILFWKHPSVYGLDQNTGILKIFTNRAAWQGRLVGSDAVTILASTAADIIIVPVSEMDFITALEERSG